MAFDARRWWNRFNEFPKTSIAMAAFMDDVEGNASDFEFFREVAEESEYSWLAIGVALRARLHGDENNWIKIELSILPKNSRLPDRLIVNAIPPSQAYSIPYLLAVLFDIGHLGISDQFSIEELWQMFISDYLDYRAEYHHNLRLGRRQALNRNTSRVEEAHIAHNRTIGGSYVSNRVGEYSKKHISVGHAGDTPIAEAKRRD